jgi:putative ABC transport system substrate-binding protein
MSPIVSVSGHADAINVLSSAYFNAHKERIAELAAKFHLPAIYEHSDFVRAGGLMAYGPSLPELFHRAATYVDRILKGAEPGELPIEQPTKFEFVINLKTARALGITISPALLARADQMIERPQG